MLLLGPQSPRAVLRLAEQKALKWHERLNGQRSRFDFGQIGRISYDPLHRNSDDISQLSDFDCNKRFSKLCHDPSFRDADRRAPPEGPSDVR